MTWFDTERLGITAAIRQADQAGLDELCWELASSAPDLFSIGNRLDELHDCLNVALASTRRAGNTRGQAFALVQLGMVHTQHGLHDLAVSHLEDALSLFERIADHQGQAMALLGLAHIDRRQARYDTALHRSEQGLIAARKADDRTCLVEALACIGLLHGDLNDLVRGEPYLEQAVAITASIGKKRLHTIFLYYLGELRLKQGRWDLAEQAFTEGLEYGRESGDLSAQAHSLFGIARAYLHQSLPTPAATLLHESLAITRTTHLEALVLTALGHTHHRLADLDLAAAYVDEAIAICRTLQLPQLLADMLIDRGDIAQSAGSNDTASAVRAEARVILAQLQDRAPQSATESMLP
jgi:tetratricopeptide (TPR) repeat protein